MATQARAAARALASAAESQYCEALSQAARQIRAREDEILAANKQDLAAAERNALPPAMLERLTLTPARLEAIAAAIEAVRDLPAIVGRVEEEQTRPNGLLVQRVRIPLGVVAMIYESRPNVTADAAALCLKSGNAVILKGGKEADYSNRVLAEAMRAGLAAAKLPENCVQLVPAADRAVVADLLTLDELIDVVIPRGGEGLIRFVAENSRIPVLKHYKGVCHVYVDGAADLEMATQIVVNAKAQRPSVCNAAETILIDRSIAAAALERIGPALQQAGVEIRGDKSVCEILDYAIPARDEDWDAEYLSLTVSIAVVNGVSGAVEHIEAHGSDHTEAIVTMDTNVAETFVRRVGSSSVMVNASTRFADGGELGLGAEIGISTTRLHAYGPMGIEGLTTKKFVIRGTGQVRQ